VPNENNILIVSPLQDYPTHSSAEVMLRAKEHAEKKGYDVSTLYSLMANRPTLELMIKTVDPVFVFYGGHGLHDRWVANAMSILDEKNAHIMKGRIIVANPVCKTLRYLGPITVRNGALAYLGSASDVWVVPNIEGETRYRDQIMDVWTNVYKDLLDGKTVAEAHERYIRDSDRLIRNWNKESYPHAREVSMYVAHNRDVFGYTGYGSIKVLPPQSPRINMINYGKIGTAILIGGLITSAAIVYDSTRRRKHEIIQ